MNDVRNVVMKSKNINPTQEILIYFHEQ